MKGVSKQIWDRSASGMLSCIRVCVGSLILKRVLDIGSKEEVRIVGNRIWSGLRLRVGRLP